MIYFILFCVWYAICGIGVGKVITNAYNESMDLAVMGGIAWPLTIIAWAFWG